MEIVVAYKMISTRVIWSRKVKKKKIARDKSSFEFSIHINPFNHS